MTAFYIDEHLSYTDIIGKLGKRFEYNKNTHRNTTKKDLIEYLLAQYSSEELDELFPQLEQGYYSRTFECRQCGKSITTADTFKDKRQVFCSASCEKKYWRHPPCDAEAVNFQFYGKPDYDLHE